MNIYEVTFYDGLSYTKGPIFSTLELAVHFVASEGFKKTRGGQWRRHYHELGGLMDADIQERNVETARSHEEDK